MKISILPKGLKYLFLNPKYFALYFLCRPENVIDVISGKTGGRGYIELRDKLSGDTTFLEALKEKASSLANEDFELNKDHYFLYAVVRTVKPCLMLETGVFDGSFSTIYLKALYDNYSEEGLDGRLISIDLPAGESIEESTTRMRRIHLPPGCRPGWLIPDNLRDRWELHIGDSRQLLPQILSGCKELDLFFHDSLHTYSHMMFEYETAWPKLKKGGVLMSHDIHWNRAFINFVSSKGLSEHCWHGFGIVRKE